jgi:hypothetical protein
MGTTPITLLSSGYLSPTIMQSVCAHRSQAKSCIDFDPVAQSMAADGINVKWNGCFVESDLKIFDKLLKH